METVSVDRQLELHTELTFKRHLAKPTGHEAQLTEVHLEMVQTKS